VGKPVRMQWMSSDEHGWDPKGPAMVIDMRGGLGGHAKAEIVAWDFQSMTPTHSSRPAGGAGGNLLAGLLEGYAPRLALTGGDRNAPTDYKFPNHRVTVRWSKQSVLRASALRGLGAPQNTFANESFIDELAAAAGADPIAFRIKHLDDSRATALLGRVREISGWQPRISARKPKAGMLHGRGVAFAHYENEYAYAAVVVEVAVDTKTGKVRVPKVYVAHDCGLIVNPDGLRNQIEGNVIQTLSRALKEQVTFDRNGVTSLDWIGYPILRFSEIPEDIVIALIDHPESPMYGAGEATAVPMLAAVANAIYDATGARLRSVPFTPESVLQALGHRKA
jgi:nicotinate dehydrogenase subunit B